MCPIESFVTPNSFGKESVMYRATYRSTFRSRSGSEPRDARVEDLEVRRLLSADFRSVDGTGNNLAHPRWGSTGVQLLRAAAPAYADGVAAPAGAGRPGARAVSNAVAASLPDGQ